MFKDCHLGPGRGLIQALQTCLSPSAPLLMLTKAAMKKACLVMGQCCGPQVGVLY